MMYRKYQSGNTLISIHACVVEMVMSHVCARTIAERNREYRVLVIKDKSQIKTLRLAISTISLLFGFCGRCFLDFKFMML